MSPAPILQIALDYLPIEKSLSLIEEPARSGCVALWCEHRSRLCAAPGSTHNHQTWPGGYADHVCEVLNYARHLYRLDAAFGRPMPFSLSDALLVLFLHDIEKPFRLKWQNQGQISNEPTLASKGASRDFREALIAKANIVLTEPQANALRYVEGEGSDYSRERRAMNELAAFCHKADVWSSRQCFAHPRIVDDEWSGACRHRTPDGSAPDVGDSSAMSQEFA